MRTGEETTHSRQKFWGRYFRFYDTLNKKKPYRHMIEWEVSLLDLEPGCKVLDAGTGSGNVAAELENRGADVMGIDFCEPALDLCRQKAPRGQFQFGDLTKPLEFEDGAFDRVVCSVVLHLFKPEQQEFALREMGLPPGVRQIV